MPALSLLQSTSAVALQQSWEELAPTSGNWFSLRESLQEGDSQKAAQKQQAASAHHLLKRGQSL